LTWLLLLLLLFYFSVCGNNINKVSFGDYVAVAWLSSNNLRADRLGQWVLGDAYLVALGAVVQRARCVRGHVGTIAISGYGAAAAATSVSVLQIQVLIVAAAIIRVVIVRLASACAVGAIDGRLPEPIAHPEAQLPLAIPLPFPLAITLLHRLLLLLPEVGKED